MLISEVQKPKSKKSSNGRLTVQMRLTMAVRYLSPLRKIIARGYGRPNKKSAFNCAVADLLRSAIMGEYPNLRVDPSRVKFTKGTVGNPLHPQLDRSGDVLRLSFDNTCAAYCHFRDDEVVLCAYNPELGIAGINDDKCRRADGQMTMLLPIQLAEKRVQVYLYTQDRNQKRFSNSMYLGEF